MTKSSYIDINDWENENVYVYNFINQQLIKKSVTTLYILETNCTIYKKGLL